jgi:hypothetical protein
MTGQLLGGPLARAVGDWRVPAFAATLFVCEGLLVAFGLPDAVRLCEVCLPDRPLSPALTPAPASARTRTAAALHRGHRVATAAPAPQPAARKHVPAGHRLGGSAAAGRGARAGAAGAGGRRGGARAVRRCAGGASQHARWRPPSETRRRFGGGLARSGPATTAAPSWRPSARRARSRRAPS